MTLFFYQILLAKRLGVHIFNIQGQGFYSFQINNCLIIQSDRNKHCLIFYGFILHFVASYYSERLKSIIIVYTREFIVTIAFKYYKKTYTVSIK